MAGGHGPDGPKVSMLASLVFKNVPELLLSKHMMILECIPFVFAR